MYKYTIWNFITKEENIIFGYSFKDAINKYKINPNEVQLIHKAYID